jgi:copper homeostasis protein (lipoprotein)
MRLSKVHIILVLLAITGIVACKHKAADETQLPVVFKGLYSFAPGAKTFQPCGKQGEYWVADSCAQLELKYAQTVTFEQPGQPVYIEVEGEKIKSAAGSNGAAYDSTLIVKKLIKLTKDIPADCK